MYIAHILGESLWVNEKSTRISFRRFELEPFVASLTQPIRQNTPQRFANWMNSGGLPLLRYQILGVRVFRRDNLRSSPFWNHRNAATPKWLKQVAVTSQDASTRWWFHFFLNLHPCSEKIPILTNIFQWG